MNAIPHWISREMHYVRMFLQVAAAQERVARIERRSRWHAVPVLIEAEDFPQRAAAAKGRIAAHLEGKR